MTIIEDLLRALQSREAFEEYRSRAPLAGSAEMEIVEGLMEIKEILDSVGDRLDALLKISPVDRDLHQWSHSYWTYRSDDRRAELHARVLQALSKIEGKGGKGGSPDTAFIVDSVAEEYGIVRSLGLEVAFQELRHENERSFDVLTCRDEAGNERVIWFDISRFFRGGARP